MNRYALILQTVLVLISLAISACGGDPVSKVDSIGKAVSTTQDTQTEPLAGCEEFQRLIETTYILRPSKLTPEERTAKSEAMDVVWEKVRADKSLIPCLRAALAQTTANSFFRFDGSNLLISLDKTDDSKKLLLSSYALVVI